MDFCIKIEAMENAFEVEIPDREAFDKAKTSKDMPYMGDYMKSYAAKTVDEVIALIKPALKNLPQSTFDEAFAEAVKEMK